ncbi:hypothetical protein lerEdw1_018607 [Lerista edwardsae]|nr:hypothetical protein lerEdw1_018607 [Lerista edwardsae]
MSLLIALLALAAGLHLCVGDEQEDALWAKLSTDLPSVQTEILDMHNDLRRKVDPPASNMVKMRWSDEAAKNSKAWADQCNYNHSPQSQRKIKRETWRDQISINLTQKESHVELALTIVMLDSADAVDLRIEKAVCKAFEASAGALKTLVAGSLFARAMYLWTRDLMKDFDIPKEAWKVPDDHGNTSQPSSPKGSLSSNSPPRGPSLIQPDTQGSPQISGGLQLFTNRWDLTTSDRWVWDTILHSGRSDALTLARLLRMLTSGQEVIPWVQFRARALQHYLLLHQEAISTNRPKAVNLNKAV